MRRFNTISSAACAILLLALLSCTPALRTDHGLVARLKNRGPVVLSLDNPYLAGNLLLAEEMKTSREISGFVTHRGAPPVIEVEKGIFGPLTFHFFYPRDNEQFTLEQFEEGWIIRGPHALDEETKKEITYLLPRQPGVPALALDSESDSTSSDSAKSDGVTEGSDLDPASGREAPELPGDSSAHAKAGFEQGFRSPISALSSDKNSEPSKGPQRTSSKPSVDKPDPTLAKLNHIVQTTGKSEAEITPKGDLVHYVTYAGENLSMIARWYSKDGKNAGRLARINHIKNPNKLHIGDIVIVPSYLLKNTSRMTQQSVHELKKLAEQL